MLSADAWNVRDLVLSILAADGRAPTAAELSRRTGADLDQVSAFLGELADAHVVVLAADGDSIRMAHPFSAAPMGFVVTPLDRSDHRRWWGGCAWDSFGISAALDLDVRIDTACPECGSPLRYESGPHLAPPSELAIWIPKPAENWWDDVIDTCTAIRTFCNADHADRWARAHPGGQVVEATTMWKLAQPWYGDRLNDDYEPHTRDHNQGLLESCGLTGDFWHLP